MNIIDTDKKKFTLSNNEASEKDKLRMMIDNMSKNKAYIYASKYIKDLDGKKTLLKQYQEKYKKYREGWKEIPKNLINNKIYGNELSSKKIEPLCIDLELAAVCDLGCPHCFRQYIATPDKIMNINLAYKLIDQAVELNVPSMKFNWRGEPLLNSSLPKIINYAKKKGILETIINTNATKLKGKFAQEIIDSGLDLLIYSFDGGTKKTYEKYRPGRFKENKFEEIIKNIKDFKKLKDKVNSPFPRTKIQMVLTEDTFKEQNEFKNLFEDYVDDISFKQYTERGGKISEDDLKKIKNMGIDSSKKIMKNFNGDIYYSKGRLPCEQPFQRMLITYDGRVSMCCYDWGSMHPVGYVDTLAIKTKNKEYQKIIDKSKIDTRKATSLGNEYP
jgi:MoaA/NifB/PqqE/SkfB family radical SAM enzyme